MKRSEMLAALVMGLGLAAHGAAASEAQEVAVKAETPPASTNVSRAQGHQQLVDRGRYLILIGACNDCHTPEYSESAGAVPESEWLTGDAIGWRGPWGTSYAPNLRLLAAGMDANAWLQRVRGTKARPPMPWYALQAMTDRDLRAVHAYLQALGPAGKPAPEFVPPERVPTTAYISLVPQGGGPQRESSAGQ